MDLNELKELVTLVSDSDVSELEIEDKGFKVKIKKNGAVTTVVPSIASVPAPPPAAAAVSPAAAPAPAGAAPPPAVEDGLTIITSPMVGTFYRQSQPGAEPFVQKGDKVEKGKVLCIIEAMKLMNEIESELRASSSRSSSRTGKAFSSATELFAIREA